MGRFSVTLDILRIAAGSARIDGSLAKSPKPLGGPNLSVSRSRAPTPLQAATTGDRRRRPMASTPSTSTSVGGGARPWRTALLTLRDESVASPSPPALLALLRRLLLSPASPSLAASAAALSPHEVAPSRPSRLCFVSVHLDLTVRVCVCRWALMWRSSRRRPRRCPPAMAPTTCCVASVTW